MSLSRFRMAIRENRVTFPSQIPSFSCQPRSEIQWRLAELFFVHGWPCTNLGRRYGLCVKHAQKLILHWTSRAINLGYLQEIPALELAPESPGAFASPYAQPGHLSDEVDAEALVVRAAQRDIAVAAAQR
jgi:hypothetical protein